MNSNELATLGDVMKYVSSTESRSVQGVADSLEEVDGGKITVKKPGYTKPGTETIELKQNSQFLRTQSPDIGIYKYTENGFVNVDLPTGILYVYDKHTSEVWLLNGTQCLLLVPSQNVSNLASVIPQEGRIVTTLQEKKVNAVQLQPSAATRTELYIKSDDPKILLTSNVKRTAMICTLCDEFTVNTYVHVQDGKCDCTFTAVGNVPKDCVFSATYENGNITLSSSISLNGMKHNYISEFDYKENV